MLTEVPRFEACAVEFDEVAEANHRIANHLAMLSGLIRLQANKLRDASGPVDPAEVVATLAAIDAKLQSVAKLHRELARPRHSGRVELLSYLRDIAITAVETLSPPGSTELSIVGEGSCCVDPRSALRVALIACEVVTNSLKYAHPTGVGGYLRLACRRQGSDLIVEIEDDGVGLPPDIDPQTNGHVGFRVIRSLVAELDATMSFASDALGVTFTLRVPMPDAAAHVEGPRLQALNGG